MAKNGVYLGVAVLAVIAVFLGYKIYQQTTGSKVTPTYQQPQDRTIPQNVGTQQIGQQTTTQRELTAEEKQVLNFPGPNTSEAERKVHSGLVNKLGNESGGTAYLDISGCRPNPIVFRVKQGNRFAMKNSDAEDHTIYTTNKVIIEANSKKTLTSRDIGDNLGDYAYGCDGSPGSGVGIIQITPL